MMNRLQSLKNRFRHGSVEPKIVCLCCAALISACATDTGWMDEETETVIETAGPAKLKQTVEMQDRLDRVGGKLLINNADLCRKQLRNLLGFSVANKYSYSPAMADLAAETYGLGDRLQIMNVIEGSGAQQAGLRRGDVLLNVDNKPAPKGAHAERDTVEILSLSLIHI